MDKKEKGLFAQQKMFFCLLLGLGYKYTENSSKKLSFVPIRVRKGVFSLASVSC